MIEFKCNITSITIRIYDNSDIIRVNDNKLLTKYLDKDGYQYITLKFNGIRKNYKVHRLVGLLIPNPNNLPCINHINGIKTHNFKANLEWCDYSHNMKHAVKLGLCTNSSQKGENHNTSKYSFEQVKEIRVKYETGKYSMRKLAKEYRCSNGYISDVINNKIRINV